MSGFKPAYALATITVLCLATVAACGGDEAQPTSTATASRATPAATPTRIATATPEGVDGVEVVPLQIGQEAELPADVALIIETGCFYCDGPTTGLYRLYRDASGGLRKDRLFTVDMVGLQADRAFIHSYAMSSDASQIVVSVCTRGGCVWLDEGSPDAETTLYRSLDGGVTWSQFGVLDGQSWVVAIAKDGVVVAGPYGTEAGAQPSYRLFPSGQPVKPPPGAGEAWPLSLPSGDLIWWSTDGRLLRSDGSEFLDVGEDVTTVNIWRKNIQVDPSGTRLAIIWGTQGLGQTGQNYLAEITTDGRLTRVFSVREYTGVGGWVDSKLLVGNASFTSQELDTTDTDFFGYLPAIFNLETGILHPLAEPFRQPPLSGRNHVQAVLRGPFARVVDTGACLNIRAEPGMAAAVLACAADGVLLRDTGDARQVDGATWRRVMTPSGVEGWASSQYLEP